MALTPRLDLRQSQSLVMTPQLQQAIKMLQLSNLELLDYVEQELEENPLLERDEGDDGEQVDLLNDAGELLDQMAEGSGEDGGLDAIDFSDPEKTSEAIGSDMDVDVNPAVFESLQEVARQSRK